MHKIYLPLFTAAALTPFALLAEERSDYLAGFEARASQIIDYAADTYIYPGGTNPYDGTDIPDPEKYTGGKMLARFHKYGPTDTDGVARGVWDGSNRARVNANTHFDEAVIATGNPTYGNLFHFRFVAPAYILHRWPEAPSVVENGDKYLGLPGATGVRGDGAGGFVFYRQDNHNAFSAEGTENHINMARTSGYLFALYAVNSATEWPNEQQHFNDMRQWLLDWSKRVYEVGFGEWDSATYAVFNTMGWLNIHWVTGPNGPAYGQDAEVHAAAKAVLDLYAASHAIRYSQTQMGGAESRANRNYSKFNDGTAYLNWLWFGADGDPLPTSGLGNNTTYATYAALSDYRPPLGTVKLARGEIGVPAVYHNAKPSYLLREPSIGREVFYRHPDYSLGSVNLNIGGFAASTWQVVPWKLMAFTSGGFPSVAWGNGGYHGIRGNTREPFTQLVQHENVLIQMNRVPGNAQAMVDAIFALYPGWVSSWNNDLVQRYPALDRGGWEDIVNGVRTPIKAQVGNITDARKSAILFPSGSTEVAGTHARYVHLAGSDTYIAVISLRQALPTDNGTNYTDSGNTDELFGLIMEVGSATDHGSFANFRTLMETHLAGGAVDRSQMSNATIAYTSLNGDVIQATYALSGEWTEFDYDWVYGVTDDVITLHQHDWQQPAWPTGANQGRQPAYSVNGQAVDVVNPWPVINGPQIKLMNQVLQIIDGNEMYSVDYSGSLPVFSESSLAPQASISLTNAATLSLQWQTRPGISYQVRQSTNLMDWSPLGSVILGDGQPASIQETPPAEGALFLRIHASPE